MAERESLARLIEQALVGERVLATPQGKKMAEYALQAEKEKATENQQSMARSGDVDVIDLREDNAFMQARLQADIHHLNLATLELYANAAVVDESVAGSDEVGFGTEFRATIEYRDADGRTSEVNKHHILQGPCEVIFLDRATESGAVRISYDAPIGRALMGKNATNISPDSPVTFSFPVGERRGQTEYRHATVKQVTVL